MDTKTILLDVGGTFIKCSDGRCIPSESGGSREDIAAALHKAVGPLDGVSGIGVAIPGPFDYESGTFLLKHKFAAAYGETFRSLLRIPAGVTLKFAHDVNAVLMGALRLTAPRDGNAALVTLGTGLGFSYAINGRVQCSPGGSPALSLWNRPLQGGGILEDRLSARGISAEFARISGEKNRTSLQIARMAFAGNPDALAAYATTGRLLGEALFPQLGELGISLLLVGGQIAGSLDLMLQPLSEALPGTEIRQAPAGAVFEGLSSLFENN